MRAAAASRRRSRSGSTSKAEPVSVLTPFSVGPRQFGQFAETTVAPAISNTHVAAEQLSHTSLLVIPAHGATIKAGVSNERTHEKTAGHPCGRPAVVAV